MVLNYSPFFFYFLINFVKRKENVDSNNSLHFFLPNYTCFSSSHTLPLHFPPPFPLYFCSTWNLLIYGASPLDRSSCKQSGPAQRNPVGQSYSNNLFQHQPYVTVTRILTTLTCFSKSTVLMSSNPRLTLKNSLTNLPVTMTDAPS